MSDLFSPAFEAHLQKWLTSRRWYAGKARRLSALDYDIVPLELPTMSGTRHGLLLVRAKFDSGEPDLYLIPFVAIQGSEAKEFAAAHLEAVVQPIDDAVQPAVLIGDGMAEPRFVRGLLDLIGERTVGGGQKLVSWSSDSLGQLLGDRNDLPVKRASGEQSNTCMVFGDRMILKLFRRLESGVNPDLEIGRYLSQTDSFRHVPELLGSLEYQPPEGEPQSIAILHRFLPGATDAWQLTLNRIDEYFSRVVQLPAEKTPTPAAAFQALVTNRESGVSLWSLGDARPIAESKSLTDGFLEVVGLLGRRTAEMHLALAAPSDSPSFAPDSFTSDYQQALKSSMREMATRAMKLLRERLPHLSEQTQSRATRLLKQESAAIARFDAVAAEPLDGRRIRCHGDYHLGQVLYADGDFTILDFEGEPARPLAERRAKRSPLQDVAGMLRSFHYARSQGLLARTGDGAASTGLKAACRAAADVWYLWTAAAFLRAYRETAGAAAFLPKSSADCDRLLTALAIEKACYELSYELNNRPDWVETPLDGLLALIA